MGKNDLLKSSLVLTLLLVFCAKAVSQGSDNIPTEGSMFYLENGKTRTIKSSTRADNDKLWSFKSVVENCFDKSLKGKEAWMMTADGKTQLKLTFEYKTDDERY